MAGRRDALIARRYAVGHTQETLAEVLEVERSTVVRWELGTSRPQPWRRRELAAALSVTLEELDSLLTASTVETSRADFAHRRDPAEGGGPALRREFIGATAGLGLGIAAAHPAQRGGGRRVDQHLPDQLRRLWTSLGKPGWERFGLTVTPEHQRVWLDHPDSQHSWQLPPEESAP